MINRAAKMMNKPSNAINQSSPDSQVLVILCKNETIRNVKCIFFPAAVVKVHHRTEVLLDVKTMVNVKIKV